MKKLVTVLLVLVMLAACISPAMATRYYTSKFAAGTCVRREGPATGILPAGIFPLWRDACIT